VWSARLPPYSARVPSAAPHDMEKFKTLLPANYRMWKNVQSAFVVVTDKGQDHARAQVQMILSEIARNSADARIVFDTETTGFEPNDVIASLKCCVELIDHSLPAIRSRPISILSASAD